MAFVIEFDARDNILRASLDGRVTDDILLDCYATMARYAASHAGCRGIADISGVTEFAVSIPAIKRLTKAPPAIPAPHMRVFVAPQAHVYGMARMFQILGEETRPNLHIVRTLDEAYRLLQVEAPEFRTVS
ncbi:MAG TPA: hypothetical protein VJX69_06490 [Terriglobales bacterium]|nr:hypothetical protein [Terriglobales bacterium]